MITVISYTHCFLVAFYRADSQPYHEHQRYSPHCHGARRCDNHGMMVSHCRRATEQCVTYGHRATSTLYSCAPRRWRMATMHFETLACTLPDNVADQLTENLFGLCINLLGTIRWLDDADRKIYNETQTGRKSYTLSLSLKDHVLYRIHSGCRSKQEHNQCRWQTRYTAFPTILILHSSVGISTLTFDRLTSKADWCCMR